MIDAMNYLSPEDWKIATYITLSFKLFFKSCLDYLVNLINTGKTKKYL